MQELETRVAQKRTSSAELNSNKRRRKIVEKIKPYKGTRKARGRTPRDQDSSVASSSEEELVHRHPTPRLMKTVPMIRSSARLATNTSSLSSSSVGDIYRPTGSQRKTSPNTQRMLPLRPSRNHRQNSLLDLSSSLNKLIWLIGITLCVVLGIYCAKMIIPDGSLLVPLMSPSVCGVVPDSDQIGFRLDKPLNKLRLSRDHAQPYAFDALNKYEKPRLREHLSACVTNEKMGDFSENTRAVTLHFAGGGQMQLKHDTAIKMAQALFIRNQDASILNVVCSDNTDIHQLKVDIATKLYQCPRSVVILHDIEKLPTEKRMSSKFGNAAGLVALERFFEDQIVEVAEVGRVDMRQAVFILISTIGSKELKNVTPKDFSRRPTEDVIELIKKATRTWAAGRPALGGRLSNSQVPFI